MGGSRCSIYNSYASCPGDGSQCLENSSSPKAFGMCFQVFVCVARVHPLAQGRENSCAEVLGIRLSIHCSQALQQPTMYASVSGNHDRELILAVNSDEV